MQLWLLEIGRWRRRWGERDLCMCILYLIIWIYDYASDCEDFLFKFICSLCACCQFFGVWFVMHCMMWLKLAGTLWELFANSGLQTIRPWWIFGILQPRAFIHQTKFHQPSQISRLISKRNSNNKISTNQKSDLHGASMVVVSFQALQQCLCFWPGEAMLLKALAQSSLRLGDFPRWGKKTRGWFQTFFYFYLYLGKWSNLTNIFQVGWNHQLEDDEDGGLRGFTKMTVSLKLLIWVFPK